MDRTHIPLNAIASEQQIANLQTLFDYLKEKGKPDHFGMESYFTYVDRDPGLIGTTPYHSAVYAHDCGTVACLAGHGPMAGIPADPLEGWYPYVIRQFSPIARFPLNAEFGGINPIFAWLFDSSWTSTDNTLAGALKRLEIALTKGIPLNARDQLYRKTPLEYSVE